MSGDVSAGVAGDVLVNADGEGQIGGWAGGELADQVIERDAADLRRAGEIGIIRYRETDLRQSEQVFARDVTRGVCRQIGQIAGKFQVQGRRTLVVEFGGERLSASLLDQAER